MSIVQSNSGSLEGNSSPSITVAFTSNVASGNILVVGAVQTQNSRMVIGDTRSNSWTQLASATNPANSSGSQNVSVWYAASSLSGSTSVTVSGSVNAIWHASIFEINGYNSSKTAAGSGAGSVNPPSVPSMTFGSGAFLLAVIHDGITTYAPPAGFTVISGGTTVIDRSIYANTVASPSTFTGTLGADRNWAQAAGSFDVTVAGKVFFESGPKRQFRREGVRSRL